ncbi:MAG: hypothetical protein JWQ90_4887 [Hydrocarboniphaga sp.]|uniref:DUF1302 domain-containing protein n=1 Tax=Hydrocarboniphaga sp. TaxID=2033016 RepID=UPI00262722A3|nr:DUF1302 family protein [Hydrocarboniphaga sp.]MDB5972437.1 hypothetical protein [Hydrocarboniphaga sp.]
MCKQLLRWIGIGALAFSGAADALDFEYGGIQGTLNSRVSVGAAVRTENPDSSLIAKQNLNPNLCGPSNCQSFTGDPSENQKLVDAPGAFFGTSKDDGDLNYDQWDLVSAVSKLSTDLSGSWHDWLRFELGAYVYFDPVNHDFDEHHPDTTFQPATTPRSGSVSNELGLDAALKRALVAADFSLFDHDLSASVGYQRIRWGESSFVVFNSLDQINPPSAVLYHQPGTPLSDIFLPTPVAALNMQVADGVSLQLIYELGWRPAVPDPGGAFGVAYNVSYDVIESDHVELAEGQAHEDPDGLARLGYPAGEISDTSFTARLLDKSEGYPGSSGQFGAKLTWYAQDINDGTEFSFYALNYHSQLPYFSANAAQDSCLRDSQSFIQGFIDCNGFIGLNPSTGLEPLPIDTVVGRWEYPKDIQMFGMSFNTSVGKWSLAGEYSLRPNMPLQVDIVDVVYAAWQPAFPRQDLTLGLDPATLAQTASSLGGIAAGIVTTDPQALAGEVSALLQSLPIIVGTGASGAVTVPSGRRAAPDYLSAYRGIDDIQGGQLIHGYQRFAVDQIDFTAIRAIGGSENPFGADQILVLTELGATHIWNLPSRSELQIEGGDANDTHASPGADGTGSGGVADASRLTPTQQTSGFATAWAWGYRLLVQAEYDNLVWGLNIKPSLMWGQDVSGIAPQPIQNFVAGTKQYAVGSVVEFGPQWSAQLQYQGWFGGGTVNNAKDRDSIALSVAYNF